MYVTERLAEWATNVSAEHTPAARLAAKHAIQDLVGCMVAGAGDEGAAMVRDAVLGWGNGEAVVAGRLGKAAAPYAALANGMSAHSLDFDDTFMEAVTHASASLVPALFALGDELGASGDAIVDAYIVGLEMHGALGLALNRSLYDQGWHATATLGVIGTAGACARLMGLDAAHFAHALNLSFSSSAGTKVQFGSMAKPLHAGLAAKNAIEAAKLAAAGVQGRVNALEGPMGLQELYGGPSTPGWDVAFEQLGSPLAIERQGLTVKRFPCCAATHRALDCVLNLQAEHGFNANDVASVDVQVRDGHVQNLRYTDPKSEFEARFSMQYCVAVALSSGTVSLSDFTPSAVLRPEVRQLYPIIEMRAHDLEGATNSEADPVPSIVTITLKDGRTLEAQQDTQRGDASNPLSDTERMAKFTDCCTGFLPEADITALQSAIAGMETLESIRDCTRLLRFEAGADRGERFERRA
jgi:2-methylcitrate dehydratase PrpD